jgi:hypothetical protein
VRKIGQGVRRGEWDGATGVGVVEDDGGWHVASRHKLNIEGEEGGGKWVGVYTVKEV